MQSEFALSCIFDDFKGDANDTDAYTNDLWDKYTYQRLVNISSNDSYLNNVKNTYQLSSFAR